MSMQCDSFFGSIDCALLRLVWLHDKRNSALPFVKDYLHSEALIHGLCEELTLSRYSTISGMTLAGGGGPLNGETTSGLVA